MLLFVVTARDYFAMPLAERTADGDPFSADAGMWLGAVLVLFAFFAAGIAVGAALPRRLDTGLAIALLVASLLVLGLIVLVAVWAGSGWMSLAVCLPFAYAPVLTIVRLAWQSTRGASPPSHRATIARPTSASS